MACYIVCCCTPVPEKGMLPQTPNATALKNVSLRLDGPKY